MMLTLWNILGAPSTKIPIDATIFISFIIPLLICYLALAALAIIPQTRAARVALWPIFALLALRAASVDMSSGNPDLRIINGVLTCAIFLLTVRTLEWTLAKKPLVRYFRPGNGYLSIMFDTVDLAINFRGYGWNWSLGFPFPRDTRPKNRLAFVLHASLSAIAHLFVHDVCQQTILFLCSSDRNTIQLGLLDKRLPCFARYLRAIIIGCLQYFVAYGSLQGPYDLCAAIGVLFFGQDPAQWPPSFDAPWRATSVGEFWGRRWHQWFRHMFVFLGGHPFQCVLGRTGIIVGGFVASGVMHSVLVIGTGGTEHAWQAFLAFAMMIPVVFVEGAFYLLTGKRVSGVAGRIWTMMWLFTAGAMVFDAVAKTGGIGNSTLIDGVRPVQTLVERLVKGFSAYLYAILTISYARG